MDKRQQQREDSAKIIGWTTIAFIIYLVIYGIYTVITKS